MPLIGKLSRIVSTDRPLFAILSFLGHVNASVFLICPLNLLMYKATSVIEPDVSRLMRCLPRVYN